MGQNNTPSLLSKVAFIGQLSSTANSPLGEELATKALTWGQALGMERVAYYQRNNHGHGQRDDRKDRKDTAAFRDLAMVAGLGSAVGLALASRKANLARKATNERILSQTETFRDIGNKAGELFNSTNEAKAKAFEELFSTVEDPAKRKYVQNTTKQIDKLISDVGKNSYYLGKNKVKAHAELKNLINEAHAKDEIPSAVAEHLHKELNRAIRLDSYPPSNVSPINPVGDFGAVPYKPGVASKVLGFLDTIT